MTLRYINLLFSLTFTECADTVVAMYRLTGGGLLAAAATVAHSIRLAVLPYVHCHGGPLLSLLSIRPTYLFKLHVAKKCEWIGMFLESVNVYASSLAVFRERIFM